MAARQRGMTGGGGCSVGVRSGAGEKERRAGEVRDSSGVVGVAFIGAGDGRQGGGEGRLNGRSNGGGGEWRLRPLKLGLKGDNYCGVMEEGRGLQVGRTRRPGRSSVAVASEKMGGGSRSRKKMAKAVSRKYAFVAGTCVPSGARAYWADRPAGPRTVTVQLGPRMRVGRWASRVEKGEEG
jgi:hypothetical protein